MATLFITSTLGRQSCLSALAKKFQIKAVNFKLLYSKGEFEASKILGVCVADNKSQATIMPQMVYKSFMIT